MKKETEERLIMTIAFICIGVSIAFIFQGCGHPIQAREYGEVIFSTNTDCDRIKTGDINLDDVVNEIDLQNFDEAILNQSLNPCPNVLDVDKDGLINATMDKIFLENLIKNQL